MTVSRRAIASWQKWPSGYTICSPTCFQVPGGGVQPPACRRTRQISASPWNRSIKQWSANRGTSRSATCSNLAPISTDPASCSPIASMTRPGRIPGSRAPRGSLAELRAQAGHAPDHDTARIAELGQVAGNPLQIGQPFFLVTPGLVGPADPPGSPPHQTPGQGPREVPRLVDDKGDHDGEHQEAQYPAGHRATRLNGSNSVTGRGLCTGTPLPVRCRTAPRRSISSARAAARPPGSSR